MKPSKKKHVHLPALLIPRGNLLLGFCVHCGERIEVEPKNAERRAA